MNLTEAQLRDFLAQNLDIVEPGLTLVDAEHYLPNSDGARGFLDILAVDRLGLLVLIELKKSSATSREAAHELYKYLGLIVENHGVERSKIRCLVVSTDWHELNVAFSELMNSTDYQFEGRILELDKNGYPSSSKEFVPKVSKELNIHQEYWVECYFDCEVRDRIAQDLEKYFKEFKNCNILISIQDYAGNDPQYCFPYSLVISCNSIPVDSQDAISIESNYRLSNNRKLIDIEGDDKYKEGLDFESDSSDIDLGVSVEMKLVNCALESIVKPSLYERDFGVIGPFQYSARLHNGWVVRRWIRIGSKYQNEKIWTDFKLNNLISGNDGYSVDNGMHLKFNVRPKNQADWNERKKYVKELLSPDIDLRHLILTYFDEVCDSYQRCTSVFNAFYPEDLIPALMPENQPFIPEVNMLVISESGDLIKWAKAIMCFNSATPCMSPLKFIEIIYGDIMGYQLASCMHEHFLYRNEIKELLNLKWKLIEYDGKQMNALKIKDSRLIRSPLSEKSVFGFSSFISENKDWVIELYKLIHFNG